MGCVGFGLDLCLAFEDLDRVASLSQTALLSCLPASEPIAFLVGMFDVEPSASDMFDVGSLLGSTFKVWVRM